MHHLGLVHRDIKSHNVLIDSTLNVKVCDFGLAKFNVSILLIFDNAKFLFCRLILAKGQCNTQGRQRICHQNYF